MKTRVPWDIESLALDKRPLGLRPRGLLSYARDSISHRTLVFILYPLHVHIKETVALTGFSTGGPG